MESDKVHITEPVEEAIQGFDPSERNLITGVIALLQDDYWRDTNKIDFGLVEGEPNMPKHQPCPNCHADMRRLDKTQGGANYQCSKHGKVFIRAVVV